MEIVLTLECALDHLPEDPPLAPGGTGAPGGDAAANDIPRKVSDLSPLPS